MRAARTWPDDLAEKSVQVGLTPVTGPSVTVTLDDAPESVTGEGVDQDLLVVHQQDIQAVANELWRGGAEAMTIQGQRVIATTGIKCVGNTVVLHGIPYAPPYRISAIGDPVELQAALDRLGVHPDLPGVRRRVPARLRGDGVVEVELPGLPGFGRSAVRDRVALTPISVELT